MTTYFFRCKCCGWSWTDEILLKTNKCPNCESINVCKVNEAEDDEVCPYCNKFKKDHVTIFNGDVC